MLQWLMLSTCQAHVIHMSYACYIYTYVVLDEDKSKTTNLIGLDENENVVNADCENEERDHLDDDQGCRDTAVTEGANGGGHRTEYNHHSGEAEHDLGVDLRKRQEERSTHRTGPTGQGSR